MQGNLKTWFAVGIGVIALFVFWLYSVANTINPEGTIYLTLRELPEETSPVSLYSYNFAEGQMVSQAADNGDYLTLKYSPDNSQLLYSGFAVDGPRIFAVASDFTNLNEVPIPPGMLIARSAQWSPDSRYIAYQAKEDDLGDDLDVEQWLVYVTDRQTGQYKFVSTGVTPLFGPNGDLLVLKEDGLYQFSLTNVDWSESETGLAGELVLPIEDGVGLANMKLNISKSGNKLAWSVPDLGVLYIYNISSWEPFTATLASQTPAYGFWPVFSPDGKYLAFIEVNFEEGFDTPFPSIVVYHTGTMQKKHIVDLGHYYPDSMYLTDWTY